MAIIAIANGEWRSAFVWMVVAVGVDGMDGMLARRVGVESKTPDFDGALLDNLVDYLTYVVVPAFFFVRSEVLPEAWRLPAAAAICLASAYQFCHKDAKTRDHFFRGFPSYWNIVALYCHYLELEPVVNLTVLLGLVLLVFVPLKWIYPSRMTRWRTRTLSLTLIWCLMIVTVLWLDTAEASSGSMLLISRLSMFYVAYYVLASLFLGRARAELSAEALAVLQAGPR
jgi:phosphatidylcholine synthase